MQKKLIIREMITILLIGWLITIIYRVGNLGQHTNDPYFWYLLTVYDILRLSNILYPSKKSIISVIFLVLFYALLAIVIFLGTYYIDRDNILLWSIHIPLMLLIFWLIDKGCRFLINLFPYQDQGQSFLVKRQNVPLYIIWILSFIIDGIIIVIFKPNVLNF